CTVCASMPRAGSVDANTNVINHLARISLSGWSRARATRLRRTPQAREGRTRHVATTCCGGGGYGRMAVRSAATSALLCSREVAAGRGRVRRGDVQGDVGGARPKRGAGPGGAPKRGRWCPGPPAQVPCGDGEWRSRPWAWHGARGQPARSELDNRGASAHAAVRGSSLGVRVHRRRPKEFPHNNSSATRQTRGGVAPSL